MRLFGWLRQTTEHIADKVDMDTELIYTPVKIVSDIAEPVTTFVDDVIDDITDIFF